MLALAAAVLGACALSATAAGLGIRRQIAEIDFESELVTGQKIPRGWDKAAGLPGENPAPEVRFPSYVNGELTVEHSHGGAFSFSMALDGGNLAYTLTQGLRAHPDSDYLLVGWVRTEGLNVARAQLRLFLIDARGEPIPGGISVSEPMGAPGGPADGQWRRFEVQLRGSDPAAAKVAVAISLVQPEIWRPPSERAVDEQDITGRCWWDDIAIYRLPRVGLRTDAAANVFGPGARPRLMTHLEGLDFADCAVILTVRSADGVARRRRIMEPPAAGDSVEQELLLERLPPGLYTADLAISAGGKVLMSTYCRFAVLAELPYEGRGRMVLDATRLPADQWPVLAALASPLRISGVKLPAWPDGTGSDGRDPISERLGVLLSRLHDVGAAVTLVLDRLPIDLRPVTDSNATVADVLAGPDKAVSDAIALLLAANAPRVARWQLGDIYDTEMAWNPDLADAYAAGRAWTGKMLDRTDLLLAWPSNLEYDLPEPGPLALRLDRAMPPEQIPAQLIDFAGQAAAVHIAAQDEAVERLGRLSDFALRYAFTRAAGVDRISIDPPWTPTGEGTAEPTEMLLVARTLAAYLGDAVCLGAARLSETSVAVIFRGRDGKGVMFIYSQPGADDSDEILVALPPKAYIVDLWGRRSEIVRQGNRAVLKRSSVPMLIAGCDAESLALRSSLRFEPAILNSTYQTHDGRLRLTNPYTQPISGAMVLTAPEGWSVSPRVAQFSLGPGQEWVGDVKIRFPYSAETGLKELDVKLELETTEDETIRAPAFFYFTLKDITFEPISVITPDGALEVRVCVINHGRRTLSFDCFAQVPGHRRQSRPMRQLGPGVKAEKVFRFPDGRLLVGKELRTGLREVGAQGPRGMVNHTMTVW